MGKKQLIFERKGGNCGINIETIKKGKHVWRRRDIDWLGYGWFCVYLDCWKYDLSLRFLWDGISGQHTDHKVKPEREQLHDSGKV